MNHPLRCQCGTIRGYVSPQGMAALAVCYCKDCQAYACFLDRAEVVLDTLGGTDIVAMFPRQVHLTDGAEALACMSLSERGILRWYAKCCNTPIGNTSRNPKTPYVGLVHSCLVNSSPSVRESFGPVRMVLNPKSARGHVKSTPLRNTVAILKIVTAMIGARLDRNNTNPFFLADAGAPIKQPRVLTKAEREQITSAA